MQNTCLLVKKEKEKTSSSPSPFFGRIGKVIIINNNMLIFSFYRSKKNPTVPTVVVAIHRLSDRPYESHVRLKIIIINGV